MVISSTMASNRAANHLEHVVVDDGVVKAVDGRDGVCELKHPNEAVSSAVTVVRLAHRLQAHASGLSGRPAPSLMSWT